MPVARLDLAQLAQLTFRAPDEARFPALRLAREVMAPRGLAGAVFNAAKEMALDHFIAGASAFRTWRRWSKTCWPGFRAKCAAIMPPSPLRMCWRWTIWHGRRAAEAVCPSTGQEVEPIGSDCARSAFGGAAWTVIAFVVALSIIVAVHEYGHYIVGRWSGIHAEVFSLGFGPVLWSRVDRRGTRWQVAALPFGGYVKFLGDADAASGKDADGMAAVARKSAATPCTAHRSGRGRRRWRRGRRSTSCSRS